MNDLKAARIGQEIIELLDLKVSANGEVSTQWGKKTPLGLFRTLERFIPRHYESLD